MNQAALFLVVLSISGIYSVRWTVRLAPLASELPLKTAFATALCAGVAALSFTNNDVSPTLLTVALIVGPLYILAPLVLTSLARGRLYNAALTVTDLLYWTEEGRGGVRRLLAQVALQQADADEALRLLPEQGADLLRVQAYALAERWRELLTLKVPEHGDNAALGGAARAQAFLELDNPNAAEAELRTMRQRWEDEGQGPIGYRSVKLTQARLYAYDGNLEGARRELQDPLPGVPPYIILAILADAAERSRNSEAAVRLYSQAYTYAPPGQRERFREKLNAYDQPIPDVPSPTSRLSVATLSLAAALVAAYIVQLWVERTYGAERAERIVAGFFVNSARRFLSPVSDTLWRYLSYAFVHGGIVHIGLNVWVLYDIGRLYETRRHWGSLLAAFVFGTVTGRLFNNRCCSQALVLYLLVGASGGVLGIAGALIADVLRSTDPRDKLLTRSLLQWVVLIVVFSLAIPGVSLWGHIGGLVGGLLWGFARQGLPNTRQLDLIAGGVSVGFDDLRGDGGGLVVGALRIAIVNTELRVIPRSLYQIRSCTCVLPTAEHKPHHPQRRITLFLCPLPIRTEGA